MLFWICCCFGLVFSPKGSANLASLKVSSVGVFLAALFPALCWLVSSVHTDLHFWHLSCLTLSSRVEHLLSSYCLISQVQHIGVNKHHFQTKLPSIYRLLPQISLDRITAILSHFQYWLELSYFFLRKRLFAWFFCTSLTHFPREAGMRDSKCNSEHFLSCCSGRCM